MEKEYCWVTRSDFVKLEEAKRAGDVVRDITAYIRYYIVQAFMFSRFKVARFSPWNPIVRAIIPEIACEDPDNCDHNAIVLLLDSVEELGSEVYESGEYAIEGTVLEKVYGKRGFSKIYELYDGDRRGVAVCTDSKPTVCVTLYEDEDSDC